MGATAGAALGSRVAGRPRVCDHRPPRAPADGARRRRGRPGCNRDHRGSSSERRRRRPLLDSWASRVRPRDQARLPDRRHRRGEDRRGARAAARARRSARAGRARSRSSAGEGQGAPDADGLIAAIPAMSLTAAAATCSPTASSAGAKQRRRGRRRPRRPAAGDHRRPRRPRGAAEGEGAEEARRGGRGGRRRGPLLRGADGQRAAGLARRGGASAAASSSSPTPPGCWSTGWATDTVRLGNELDRLALWAGEGGQVTAEDLEAMVADTSEAMVWALSDALVERDAARGARRRAALGAGREPSPRSSTGREAAAQGATAVAGSRPGRRAKEVESGLGMHPYAAKMLVRRVSERRAEDCARRPARSPTSSGGPAAAPSTPTSGAHPRRAPRRRSGGRRVGGWAPARMRAARAFLRAPLRAWRAPLLDGLVDPRDELAMLARRPRRRRRATAPLEAAEMRLDRARQAPVLDPLALGARDPLLL